MALNLVDFYNEHFMGPKRNTPWTLEEVLASQWLICHKFGVLERELRESAERERKATAKQKPAKAKCPRPHHLLLNGERCPTCKVLITRKQK